ncbi:MAG: hypothetical protein ACRDRK_07045 [Pseudonocardia sp.]
MTAVSVWFVLGLFLDAFAHSTVPELETFFTPWHAVFYSGFAATGGWVLWTVWRNVGPDRQGLAAVPVGYGMTMVALPVFALSGAIDMLWHTVLGIETGTDIFFSPSHLGLVASMVIIVTSPLRSAWSDPGLGSRPSLRALLPAVVTLSFAGSLILLFLSYGNALFFGPNAIVEIFSTSGGEDADLLAGRIVVTTIVLLAPLLLLLARRWHLPFGAATIGYSAAAAISATLTGLEVLDIPLTIVVAGVGVDLLARRLRPTAERRTAFWVFAATAPLLTWSLYLGVASAVVGRLPAVTELWTGIPIVTALVGWSLAALMLPNAVAVTSTAPEWPGVRAG